MLASALACQTPPPEPEPPQPSAHPDILVVVLDTVRKDRLGCYGYSRDTSPHLDRLAARSTVYDDVTSAGSWTWPSHAALFTGEPPWRSGAHFTEPERAAVASEESRMYLSALLPELPTLAEALSEQGYHTAAMSSNSLLMPELGLTRGFIDARYSQAPVILDRDRTTMERALGIIVAPRDEPLFLLVNLLSAHSPFLVTPAPWVGELAPELQQEPFPEWFDLLRRRDGPGLDIYNVDEATDERARDLYAAGRLEIPPSGLQLLSDLYDANVRLVDHMLGKLIEAWEREHPGGIVAVVSDHGEFLGEHGLLDHGRSVYAQVTHVPLVIHAPERLAAGRVPHAVQLRDLQPTLLELALGQTSTRSLLGLSEDRWPIQAAAWPDLSASRAGSDTYRHGWRLYREGAWALVSDHQGEQLRLFDVEADPGMSYDLGPAHPELVQRLAVASLGAFPEATSVQLAPADLPEDVQRSLEALGYMEPASP